jgi:ABC-2 type transport system ATP-binding protein
MTGGPRGTAVESAGVLASGISKRFGDAVAVERVDLALPARGVCGLLGPNGAGKSTTIRMIAGVFAPDAGELRVAGLDARRDAAALRAAVGYLPESAPLFPELTPREYLRYRAGIAGIPRARARLEIDRVLERCDARHFGSRCCGTLSKGMQQRVGLAAAILGDPRVVILDEPSVGLDPSQTITFRGLVRELGESRLVLFSSHLLAEVEAVCTELAVIARGRLLAQESIDRFRARAASRRLRVESDRPLARSLERVFPLGGVEESALDDGWWRAAIQSDDARAGLERVGRAASEVGAVVRRLEPEPVSLESVFVELISDRTAGAP